MSSSGTPEKAASGSAAISARSPCSPSTIAARSSSLNSPAPAIAFAHATEPVMSASHSRQSKGSDALNRAMKASMRPEKRPPQSCTEDQAW